MSIEGQVAVKIKLENRQITSVSVASKRPLLARKLLQHQPAQAAIDMVGSLFQICGKAQSTASVEAIEQAMGIQASPQTLTARQQLLRMETLREHVWRLLLDWPLLLGETADKEAMKQMLELTADWQKTIDPQQQAYRIAGQLTKPDNGVVADIVARCGSLLKSTVFTAEPELWFQFNHRDQLLEWAKSGQTTAARLFQMIVDKDWAAIGHSDIEPVPPVDQRSIEAILTGDDADTFMQRPAIDDQSCETTPYSRQMSHPLILSLYQAYGNGLLPRLAAVLIEMCHSFIEMKAAITEDEPARVETPLIPLIDGTGIGIVNAARGLLIHRVELDNDSIGNYQIVAPTEWNFHPQGALAKGLTTLSADEKDVTAEQAELLIHALDPCVRFSLEIEADA